MKKIKILKIEFVRDNNCDYYGDEVTRSVTNWEDVSDEDYNYLMSYDGEKYLRKNKLIVISMPENQQEVISDTVKGIIRDVELQEKKMQALHKKQKELEAKAAEKKRLKAIEKARKLLEKEGQL
jgi:hypothetical protein